MPILISVYLGADTQSVLRCSVFYKMRNNHFFPPAIWAFAMSVTQIPWAIVETVLYTLIVYFFVGESFSSAT